MRRWPALLAFFAALTPGAMRAAPLERDLGQGLAYFRIHSIASDLPPDESVRRRPCVVDVRYVRGNRKEATALLDWLKSHAGPKSPVFLLANSDTAPVLLVPLNSASAVPELVVLGPAARGFEPDIALSVAPALERRAYDALEKGASIESLITAPVDKARNDEERLDREHLTDSALQADGASQGETMEFTAPEQPAKPAPAPLIDPVLQRAVQLHRALLALKRL